MYFPSLCMNGGIRNCGIAHLRFLVSTQWRLSVTGTVSGLSLSFQSGISSSIALGSITAPERM